MPKLTAKQQEVVNLMADGWGLNIGDSIVTGRGAWLSSPQGVRTLNVATAHNLVKQKVVEESDKSDWRVKKYQLNDIGKSLAQPLPKKRKTVTWYAADMCDYTAEPVEVLRETEQCLFFECPHNGEKREPKRGGWRDYFPTAEEALGHVRLLLERNVKRAESNLKDANQRLESARAALAAFNEKEGE